MLKGAPTLIPLAIWYEVKDECIDGVANRKELAAFFGRLALHAMSAMQTAFEHYHHLVHCGCKAKVLAVLLWYSTNMIHNNPKLRKSPSS